MSIVNIRWKCWETNSSTMNQIAIYMGESKKTELPLEGIIEINGNIDFTDETQITNSHVSLATKINIIYGTILEIEDDYKSGIYLYQRYGVIDENDISVGEIQKYRQNLFDILNEAGINYKITNFCNSDDNPGYLGLSGITESIKSFLDNKDDLKAFLFKYESLYTFGEVNAWPGDNELGDTGKSADGYKTFLV